MAFREINTSDLSNGIESSYAAEGNYVVKNEGIVFTYWEGDQYGMYVTEDWVCDDTPENRKKYDL